MPFDSNVFINCPFDRDFKRILRAIIFTVAYAGLEPRICQTVSSGDVRIEEIKELIRTSKFGIHDLSRSRPLQEGDIPRFNMPYELGIDIGCCTYGNAKQRTKSIIILEKEPYHYHRVLSDIGGQDIFRHNDNPREAMSSVRDWLVNNDFGLPGANFIWIEFNQFRVDLFKELAANGRFNKKEVEAMPEGQYIPYVKKWMS